MPPKKPVVEKNEHSNSWRTNIENANLDEASWKVKVIMMEAAGSEQDRMYLNKFESFAAEEKRFVVKIICKTETIFMVNQLGALGGEKKIKDDNLQVFEEGLTYLKDKKDIPPNILALIIKHLIMKMKEEYLFIRRQRLELREGMRRESATMVDKAEVRGTVNVKPPEVEPPPLPPKSKKGKGAQDLLDTLPEPDEGKKYNTQLRLRGEEWRDKVYVDDFPMDGPNLYVAVTGFAEPNLPGCLVKIGVPLTAVVQIRIDASTTRVPSTLLRSTKRGQSQTVLLADKSQKFWEDLQALRIDKKTADDFNNTAFIVFSPPYWESDNLSGKPDKIYDELCFLMYDVQDLSRQHVHYLENMGIIGVPKELKENRYYNYFCTLIHDLPLECTTLYSVLDGILQTICKSHECDNTTSRSSLSTALTMIPPLKTLAENEKEEKAKNLVTEVFNSFCKTDANRKAYRLTYGEEYETHRNPIIINYGDFAKYNTFHLGNINLDNIVWSSLLNMPVNKLWHNQKRPYGELEAKINFHINVLLSCFEREDVETAELNRLIHILAFRKLFNNRSSLKKRHLLVTTISDFKKVYLKRSILAEPLQKSPSVVHSGSFKSPSFPSMTRSENISIVSCEDSEKQRIKFLFDCPDISELASAAEIANQKPISNFIDDFDYFEDFSGISALQVMLDAFSQFNCVDYKYCEVTDCFLLMFFNSHDKEGISREEWRCHLPTPLCLQDFFDFVLDEHYDWIKNEEKLYDETMVVKSQSEHQTFNDLANKSCVETTDVELDLLMEGSLKYEQIQAMEEQTTTPEETVTKSKSKKSTTISPASTAVDSKSSRKTKSNATTTPKLRKSFMFTSGSQSSVEIPCKPFLGYDLGNRRVEVFGKDAVYFSKDGTRVKTMYTLIIPMNMEYILMNVVPGNGYNEFWVYKAVGDAVSSEITDDCESFRITSKDQVMINIKKQTYKVPVVKKSVENLKPKEFSKSPSGRASTLEPQIFETKMFHSFYVTWPNGLITESVHENNCTSISHIKQYFLNTNPDLDEDMRCISLNGEVVIFKRSGIIEVLNPDGSNIKITKCWKQVVVPEIPEESEISSNKSRKSGKSKDKPSKTTSKSSKNVLNDEDKHNQDKPLEYELMIEEFETIATSGLRQRWIKDDSFDIEQLLIRTATDHCQGEIFSRRMDGTHILLNKDGIQIVTFPNKTRIITRYVVEDEEFFIEWTDEEKQMLDLLNSDSFDTNTARSRGSVSQKSYIASTVSTTSKKIEEEEEPKIKGRTDGYISVKLIYTIEHPNFTTISINKAEEKISIDSPNNTSVEVDASNFYNITLDKSTSAKFNGDNLHISYEACPECRAYTSCDINMKSNIEGSLTRVAEQSWLKMKDSFCKLIVVNNEGSINLYDEPCFEEMINVDDLGNAEYNADTELSVHKTESSVSHGKCRETYLAKTMRFFVLKRDLTCSELVHRVLLEKYKLDCRWQPWYSINHCNTFGDHRSLLSLLTPIHLTETEKWLMDSKLANTPRYLTYKDLKKDTGKGFYHWMRPYERFEPKPMKPDNVLLPRLPRAFMLRILELQWSEAEREELKGACELLNAIFRYRRVLESDCETLLHVPIVDLRPEDERSTNDIIQALAHKVYEDLKAKLAADVQSRAKATITTKPAPPMEEISMESEISDEASDIINLRCLEEERESLLKQVEASEEMSAGLKRYWRTRAEELKEEQFYRYLLREGSVPPYFRNVLGGAIWWEMNTAAGDAVTKAERRKMKCVCADEARADEEILPFM